MASYLSRLSESQQTQHVRIETAPGTVRRAALAIILRIQPAPGTTVAEDEQQSQNLEEFLSHDWVQKGQLEVAYIKRTTKETDRWSGQMAFPGGKQEKGESDRQTAERETLEEVGIDLSTGFLLLGRLNDRNVRVAGGKRIMVLCAFVYLQVTADSPPAKVQASEVDLFYFVPVKVFEDHLLSKKWIPVTRDVTQSVTLLRRIPLITWTGFSTLHFPSVILPRCETHPQVNVPLVLWGLTFEITSEMLVDMGIEGDMNRIPMKFAHYDMNLLGSFWWSVSQKRLEPHLGLGFVFGLSLLFRCLLLSGVIKVLLAMLL